MKKNIIAVSLSIMLISNILMIAVIEILYLRSFIAMFLFSTAIFILWKYYLKKQPYLYVKHIQQIYFLKTLPLVIVPLLGIIFLLLNQLSLNMGIISLMLLTSIATGVYEELLFRGIVFGSFQQANINLKTAVLLSAALFSLIHVYTVTDYETIDFLLKMLNTFMMGVVFAYIYYITKNLLYIIMIHAIWDFESFLASTSPVGLHLSIVLFLLTIIYFIWSCRQINSK